MAPNGVRKVRELSTLLRHATDEELGDRFGASGEDLKKLKAARKALEKLGEDEDEDDGDDGIIVAGGVDEKEEELDDQDRLITRLFQIFVLLPLCLLLLLLLVKYLPSFLVFLYTAFLWVKGFLELVVGFELEIKPAETAEFMKNNVILTCVVGIDVILGIVVRWVVRNTELDDLNVIDFLATALEALILFEAPLAPKLLVLSGRFVKLRLIKPTYHFCMAIIDLLKYAFLLARGTINVVAQCLRWTRRHLKRACARKEAQRQLQEESKTLL